MPPLEQNQPKNKKKSAAGGALVERAPGDSEAPRDADTERLEAVRASMRACFGGFFRGGLRSAIDLIDVALRESRVSEAEATELERLALELDALRGDEHADADADAERLLGTVGRHVAHASGEARADYERRVADAREWVRAPGYPARKARRELRAKVAQRPRRRAEEREKAERARAQVAEIELLKEIKQAYLQHLQDPEDDGEEAACSVCVVTTPRGYSDSSIRDLQHFAQACSGALISRSAPTLDATALCWEAARRRHRFARFADVVEELLPLTGRVQCRSEWVADDAGRHWFALVDAEHTAPPNLNGGGRAAYAESYRRTLPSDMRDQEIVVCAEPGRSVVIVLWASDSWSDSEVGDYARRLIGERAEHPRWRPASYPLWVGEPVYLPSLATSPVVVGSIRERARRAERTVSIGAALDVGIPSLARQFRVGGLPMGSRVVILGLPGQGKTTLALHLAETAAAQGWLVVWLAYDEPSDKITARRRQRRGASPRDALGGADALEALGADLLVLAPGEPFEEVAREVAADPCGKPVLFVIDSIQKLETQAGEGKGERERITAAIDAIQRCQKRSPSIVVMTSETARGSGASKGSGGIDYGATLSLRVARKGTTLHVAIAKNRDGSEEPFALEIDAAGQTLIDPETAAARAKGDALWSEIEEALRNHGPVLSRTAIAKWVRAGTDALRAALDNRVSAGVLLRVGGGYRLP